MITNFEYKANIPRIIHQIIGPGVNELIERCINSWTILEKEDFQIIRWDDSKISEFIFDYHRFSYDAFVDARNHAEAADIARYLIIYTFGGYYVDWDIELLNLNEFFYLSNKYVNGYMLVDPPNGTLASEYFCSIKNDAYLKNLSRDIADLYETGKRDDLFTPQFSGPYRMRDSLIDFPSTSMVSVPVKEVFAYDYSEIRNPPEGTITKAMIHYWIHSWLS